MEVTTVMKKLLGIVLVLVFLTSGLAISNDVAAAPPEPTAEPPAELPEVPPPSDKGTPCKCDLPLNVR